jgi:hypothetical protein
MAMKFLSALLFVFFISISLSAQDKSFVKPQIKAVVNDSIEDFKHGIRASSLRTVELRVIPDTYIVTEFQISLVRGSKVVGTRTFYSNKMDLLHTLMAKPGDRLIVEAKHIMQANPDKAEAAEDIRFNKHREEIPIK